MQEKYGFIYIWYDKKYKRFYIGSHWGFEDDGYVCSSNWMRKGYRDRQRDFKRRIIQRIHTNRQDLLNEEQRWLDMIPREDFGKRYYNKNAKVSGYWWVNEETRIEIGKKVSKNHTSSGFREAQSERMKGDNNPSIKYPESIKRASEKKRGLIPWNKGLSKDTDERVAKYTEKWNRIRERNNWPKGIWSEDSRKKAAENAKNMNIDRVWYVNPDTNKCIHIHKDKIPPEGFIRGRCKTTNA